jgi:hypothetical protein
MASLLSNGPGAISFELDALLDNGSYSSGGFLKHLDGRRPQYQPWLAFFSKVLDHGRPGDDCIG